MVIVLHIYHNTILVQMNYCLNLLDLLLYTSFGFIECTFGKQLKNIIGCVCVEKCLKHLL